MLIHIRKSQVRKWQGWRVHDIRGMKKYTRRLLCGSVKSTHKIMQELMCCPLIMYLQVMFSFSVCTGAHHCWWSRWGEKHYINTAVPDWLWYWFKAYRKQHQPGGYSRLFDPACHQLWPGRRPWRRRKLWWVQSCSSVFTSGTIRYWQVVVYMISSTAAISDRKRNNV